MGQLRRDYDSSIIFSNFTFFRLTIFYLALSKVLTTIQAAPLDAEQKHAEPDLQDPCTYLSAIYDAESIRYPAPRTVTFYTNDMIETILNPHFNRFMGTFGYLMMKDQPYAFHPDQNIFPLISFKHFNANNVLTINGFSGSENINIILGYRANFKNGYILAIGSAYNPVIRIKVDTANLFKLFGEDSQEVIKGEEIYYAYLNPKTLTLFTGSMGYKFENDVDHLDWSIETSKPFLGKKVEITEWFHETGENLKLQPLSFFNLTTACKEKERKKYETLFKTSALRKN